MLMVHNLTLLLLLPWTEFEWFIVGGPLILYSFGVVEEHGNDVVVAERQKFLINLSN